MKTMVTWSAKSGEGFKDAVRRFLAGEAAPEPGVTILGRWHSVDLSIGFTLYEATDMAALYASAAKWADILDLKNYIVIEDNEAGPILASLKK
jgi:Domain of unknown function (DUF3303)